MKTTDKKDIYIPAEIDVVLFSYADIVTNSNMDPGGWVSEDSW